MMKRLWFGILILAGVFLVNTDHVQPLQIAHSQDEVCLTIVRSALQEIGSACTIMGQNEACYGNNNVLATFQDPALNQPFETQGDIASLTDLTALFTEPIDLEAGTWGIALMSLQTSTPTTLVLLGDTKVTDTRPAPEDTPTCIVTNAQTGNVNIRSGPGTDREVVGISTPEETLIANGRNAAGDWLRVDQNGTIGWIFTSLFSVDCDPLVTLPEVTETDAVFTPMQAITLQTGGESVCEQAPNGLLVHSPSGQHSRIVVNGVVLEFASAAFITTVNNLMTINGLEGHVSVQIADDSVILPPGTFTTVPLSDTLIPTGPPNNLNLITDAGALPALLNVLIYGESLDTALARASDQRLPLFVDQRVPNLQCGVGQSLTVNIPLLGNEVTSIAITYGSRTDEALAATIASLSSLQVTCRQEGTYTLVVVVQYGDGSGETILYTFDILMDAPVATEEPNDSATSIAPDSTPEPDDNIDVTVEPDDDDDNNDDDDDD